MLSAQDNRIQGHYGRQNLNEIIQMALKTAGKDPNHLTLDDLVSVDEFHIRGREATRELAEQLDLNATQKVLDVGSGTGGASRYLAATYGCQVTGLDLTAEYCRVAQSLSDRMGLASKLSFRQGSALDMPFEANTFDVVWTQHAVMNIEDKPTLYAEIARVLKPNGGFAMYDILAGPVSPVIFPVPWAREPSISFLSTPDALREILENAGLRIRSWRDTSAEGLAWFKAMVARVQQQGGMPALGFHLLMGPDFPQMVQNQIRNLDEKRIVLIDCVAEKMPVQ